MTSLESSTQFDFIIVRSIAFIALCAVADAPHLLQALLMMLPTACARVCSVFSVELLQALQHRAAELA
jgi:hypothetical protein